MASRFHEKDVVAGAGLDISTIGHHPRLRPDRTLAPKWYGTPREP
jgi:hypothetical protein